MNWTEFFIGAFAITWAVLVVIWGMTSLYMLGRNNEKHTK